MSDEQSDEILGSNDIKEVDFKKILINAIPRNEDVGIIKFDVDIDPKEFKHKSYEINYKVISDPKKRTESPRMFLTISDTDAKSKNNSQEVKLIFTSDASLKIIPVNPDDKIGLSGGNFTLYKTTKSAKLGLKIEDDVDSDDISIRDVVYQTFSNFDTISFDNLYQFNSQNTSINKSQAKVHMSLKFGEKPLGILWLQNVDSNGNEWMHHVPDFKRPSPSSDDSSCVNGYNLLCTVISNVLLRLVAYNFNFTDNDKTKDVNNIFRGSLPTKEQLQDKRAVNLKAIELDEYLRDKELFFRWNTISAICASLNSGKNLILVGPPGCGKTKLALELANYSMSSENGFPLLCTASPAWSTGDLVGRYLPCPSGNGLIFDEGFFLKAIDKNKWLIVDEINRANIDSCFGELFSILSNQPVELPFKVATDSDSDEIKYKSVGVVPYSEERRDEYMDYKVPSSFRMIGTMNDADRGQLATLSFALQRRFNILYIDAPIIETIEKIINAKFDKFRREIWGSNDEYFVKIKNSKSQLSIEKVKELYLKLFCYGTKETKGSKETKGLVSENIVGVSILLDSMKFVLEGLREESTRKINVVKHSGEGKRRNANELFDDYLKSWVAKSLAALLFPQLGGVSDEKRKITIVTLKNVFKSSLLCNLQKSDDDGLIMVDDSEFKKIDEFLKFHLKKHLDDRTVDDLYEL